MTGFLGCQRIQKKGFKTHKKAAAAPTTTTKEREEKKEQHKTRKYKLLLNPRFQFTNGYTIHIQTNLVIRENGLRRKQKKKREQNDIKKKTGKRMRDMKTFDIK